jgi:hypothetical protein
MSNFFYHLTSSRGYFVGIVDNRNLKVYQDGKFSSGMTFTKISQLNPLLHHLHSLYFVALNQFYLNTLVIAQPV